ncbi:MAG: SusD/RagB family nutrient-binding outer membrane lipoprotein, partial [Bacteroidaceae bacterium]|nr:SusD/RagB family nutrient-binding outer membrane lipoprotein [Bacteroidaceae bacterium]
GALRGWNMGGTAQEFYERGIQNAYLEDPMSGSEYLNYVNDYMQREEPIAYTSVDPIGDGAPLESVTKIGVAWNEGDDNETKLEKIITQKYLALFPLSTEAWAEMRRTGYPKMFPVLNADDGDGSIKQGDIIRRIPWVPTDPIALNMVEFSGIPALGGPDEQATRLWWDVDVPNF